MALPVKQTLITLSPLIELILGGRPREIAHARLRHHLSRDVPASPVGFCGQRRSSRSGLNWVARRR